MRVYCSEVGGHQDAAFDSLVNAKETLDFACDHEAVAGPVKLKKLTLPRDNRLCRDNGNQGVWIAR